MMRNSSRLTKYIILNLAGTKNRFHLKNLIRDYFDTQNFEERSIRTRTVHSRLTNFDTTGYHHLGAASNDTCACEISQAHPADLLNISKFINIHHEKMIMQIIVFSELLSAEYRPGYILKYFSVSQCRKDEGIFLFSLS